MLLRSLTIDGYGRFAGSGEPVSFGFAPGLNVLVGPNESGKSTVIACILDLLFAPTRRERERYQPWATPAIHAACLCLETSEGETVELRRTFGGDGRAVEVRAVTNGATGRVATRERALRDLLGVELGTSDRGVFTRTCCITQDDILPFEGRPGRDQDLVRALEAALTGGVPGMTVSAAIGALTRHLGTLHRLPEQRRDRELETLHLERERLETELLAAREARARLSHLLTSADDLRREAVARDEQVTVLRRALQKERDRAALLKELRSCHDRLDELADLLGQVDAAQTTIRESEAAIRALPTTCEAWEGRRDEIVALGQRQSASERTLDEIAGRVREHEAEVTEIRAQQAAVVDQIREVERPMAALLLSELRSARDAQARAEGAAGWSAAHAANQDIATRYGRARELAERLDAVRSRLAVHPQRLADDPGVTTAAIERQRRVVRASREADSAEAAMRTLGGSRRLPLWLTWGVVPGALLLIAALVLLLSGLGAFVLVPAMAAVIGLVALISHRIGAVQRPGLEARQALRRARAELATADRELAELLASCGCDSLADLEARAGDAAELRREAGELAAQCAAALGDDSLEHLAAEADRLAGELEAARQAAGGGAEEPAPVPDADLRLRRAREACAQARARLDESGRSRGLPVVDDVDDAADAPAGDGAADDMATLAARLADLDRVRAELGARLNQVEGRLQVLAADRYRTERSAVPDRELRDQVCAGTQAESLDEALARLEALEEHRRSASQAQAQLGALTSRRTEAALREEHRSLAFRRVGIEERIAREFSGEPMTPEQQANYELRVERLQAGRDEARAAEQLARGEAAAVSAGIAGTAELRERLATVKRRIEVTERRIRAAEEAIGILQEASAAVHVDLARPVLGLAQDVFCRLTQGRYERLSGRIDDAVSIGPCREGESVTLSPEALSRGTREQLYFAVRYAFARVLAGPDRRPLMLLDDPFVNFDEERAQAALDFIVDASREHQVLFCTHSEAVAVAVGERGHRISL